MGGLCAVRGTAQQQGGDRQAVTEAKSFTDCESVYAMAVGAMSLVLA